MRIILVLTLLFSGSALAGGTLSQDIRIPSAAMGYDIQYRVYVPEGLDAGQKVPVLFITDGPMYIQRGQVTTVMNRLIGDKKMEPVVAVFVDSRNPDNLFENRRNDEFFCNENYLLFYMYELIPAIEKAYPVQQVAEARTILGVSFGGLNAACFGLLGHKTFTGIGMHSPANHPVENLLPAYEAVPRLPLRIFLSTGYPNDNSTSNRKFRRILKNKGYDMKYIQTTKGHNWTNWRPLIDDALLFFYGHQTASSPQNSSP